MRNILLVVGVAGLVGLFSACGGSDHAHTLADSTGGKTTLGGRTSTGGKSSGTSGKSTGGTDGLGGADNLGGSEEGGAGTGIDSAAPTVVITSPSELTDPNEDGVLSGSTVTVTCNVTQSEAVGSSKVNQASVKIAILGADGKVIEEKGAAQSTDSEYTADFSLTAVPAGIVGFRCTGEDVAMHVGSNHLQTFLDKGPAITIIKPIADSAHALAEPLDIEFTVEPSLLAKDDTNAEVDSVALQVAGRDIGLDAASDKPGHYRVQVNLADPKLYNPSPSGGIFVTVDATNKRTPTAVKATAAVQTSIDGAGPAIQITDPGDKQVVGGKVKLTFSVTDAISGVDPQTIVATLNKVDYAYDEANDAWTNNGGVYTFEFDSRQIKDAFVQITVNVGATDKVGNVSSGTSELLFLDNYPPSVDLDPLNIRAETAEGKCSRSFDPVGLAAKNDLDQVALAGTFRTIAWDNTNHIDEIPILHFSKVNQGSVHLYLEEDSAKPLLIDKDKDGFCDDVPEVDSTNSLQLGAVPKLGGPWFALDDAVAPAVSGLACQTQAGAPPQALCTNEVSDMWQVIQDEFNLVPVVYAASPTPNSVECTGVSWEFGTKLTKNGWVCFAARAVDNVGNVGVSRPIRLCANDPGRGAAPACATSSTTPPTCTDGCTPQPRWGNGAYLWK